MEAKHLPKRVADNIGQFGGRAWLLRELTRWWRDSDDRHFLLIGGPGTGKSMITAWLAGFGPSPGLPEDAALRGDLVRAIKAVYFCQASNSARGPKAFAKCVANRLKDSIDGFTEAFAATHSEHVSLIGRANPQNVESGADVAGLRTGDIYLGSAMDSQAYAEDLVAPLRALFEQGYDEDVLIIVDAIDEEAAFSGDAGLAEMLSRDEGLPSKVRFIITSRDEPRIRQFFERRPFDLIKDAPRDADDVLEYVRARLRTSPLEPAKAERLAMRVARSAHGIFLYAALVLDDLLPGLDGAIDVDEFQLPTGLPGIYRAFLRREVGKGELWHSTFKPLLGAIAVSQGSGLDARRLRSIVGRDLETPLEACRQYLVGPMPHGPFRLFHKSFGDFLLEDGQQDRFHIDAREMHARVGESLWKQYSANWDKADAYTLDSLAIHLAEGCVYEKFDGFLAPGWFKARTRQSRSFDGFGADVNRIWNASLTNEDREAAFATGFRCALLRGSLNASARSFPSELIKRAVELGLMSPEGVFGMVPDLPLVDAAILLAALLGSGRLSEADSVRAYEDAMDLAKRDADPRGRLRALAAIASSAPEDKRQAPLDLALKIADDSDDPAIRTFVYEKVAEATHGELRRRIVADWLTAIDGVPVRFDGWSVAAPLKNLAPYADEPAASQAWMLAKKRVKGAALLGVGTALLPRLPVAERNMALKLMFNFCGETLDRAWDRQLPPGQRKMFAPGELPVILDSLEAMIPRLSVAQRNQLVQASFDWKECMDADSRLRWEFQIIPLLEPRLTGAMVAQARRLPYAVLRFRAYRWLAPMLGAGARISLLNDIRQSDQATDVPTRMQILHAWHSLLTEEDAFAVRDEILSLTEQVLLQDGHSIHVSARVSLILQDVFPMLDASRHAVALKLAFAKPLAAFRHDLLSRIAPKMDVSTLRDALAMLNGIRDEPARVRALAALAHRMHPGKRIDVLKHFKSLLPQMQPTSRCRSIIGLIPLVDECEREKLSNDALKAWTETRQFSGALLKELAPYLDANGIREARGLVERSPPLNDLDRCAMWECLAILAGRLIGSEREQLVDSLLDALPDGASGTDWALRRIVEFADQNLLGRCLHETLKLSPDVSKGSLLISIAEKLVGEGREVAIGELRKTLGDLEPGRLRLRTEAASIVLYSGEARVQAISNIVSTLAPGASADEQAWILGNLLPHLDASDRVQGVDRLLSLVPRLEGTNRKWTLLETARFMNAAQLTKAMEIAQTIPAANLRSDALAQLALERIKRWHSTDSAEPLWALCTEVLHAMRNSERTAAFHFLADVLGTEIPVSHELLERMYADIEHITTHWSFDLAAPSRRGGPGGQ